MYHEKGHYPTENGIVVSPYEIKLPHSNTFETNLHHGEFEARTFGRNVIYLMLRNLKCLHWEMPIDQHNWIHYEYATPKEPSLMQAMTKLEEQLDCGGLLEIKHKGKGYTDRLLTNEDFNNCVSFYDQLKK